MRRVEGAAEASTETRVSVATLAGVVGGEVRMRRLSLYSPNPWNPNEMDPEEYASLKEILRVHGWARSDALLVWATNEAGKRQNLVINGEHRQKAALEIGMVEGPVVEMHRISRREAVEWTIRLDKARGSFNPTKLRLTLARELDFRNVDDQVALRLGFSATEARDLRLQIPAPGGRSPLDAVPTPDGRPNEDPRDSVQAVVVELQVPPASAGALVAEVRALAARYPGTVVNVA
jgi:ParB-like chromosome segregation protein Spo0J